MPIIVVSSGSIGSVVSGGSVDSMDIVVSFVIVTIIIVVVVVVAVVILIVVVIVVAADTAVAVAAVVVIAAGNAGPASCSHRQSQVHMPATTSLHSSSE